MPITITMPPEQLTASKNDTWITVNTNDVNVIVKMEVYAQPGNFLMASMIAPTDQSGNSYFNLKKILQSMGIAPDILRYQLPGFNQMVPSLSTNNIKWFSFIFFTIDRVNGTQISSLVYGNDNHVILSGKSFMQATKKFIDIIGTGTAKRKFLTWQPASKNTRPEGQEYLYYLHNEVGISTGAVSISLKVVITLQDKTTLTKILLPFTISDKQIVLYPAGVSQLNLYSYVTGGKKIVSYTIALVLSADTVNPITETFNYLIDERCFPDGKEFIFLNSLGGMDSVYAVSTDETGLALMTETAERFLPYNYDVRNGQYYNYIKQYFNAYRCTTDLLTSDNRLYFTEFFSSSNVWEVSENNFIPVILTDSNYTLQKGRASLQSIQFGYRQAFDEVAYTV